MNGWRALPRPAIRIVRIRLSALRRIMRGWWTFRNIRIGCLEEMYKAVVRQPFVSAVLMLNDRSIRNSTDNSTLSCLLNLGYVGHIVSWCSPSSFYDWHLPTGNDEGSPSIIFQPFVIYHSDFKLGRLVSMGTLINGSWNHTWHKVS
jgi:hypothetical protein